MTDTVNALGDLMPGASVSLNRSKQSSDGLHHILSLNGDTQFLKFAKPILGGGQGEIRIVCKVKDLAGLPFYLFDGTGDVSRMYTYRSHDQDRFVGPNIATLVNLISDTPIYGELCEIVITGQFTDLEISRFFARYSDTEFAKAQVFSISYKDDNHNFAYDLTKAVTSCWLPEGEKQSRSYTPAQATVSIPNAYNTLAIPNSDPIEIGDCYLYKFRLVSCPVGASARMRSLNGSSGGYISEGGIAETVGVADATAITLQGSIAGDYVVEMLEVREVSNALILQSPSANPADDFEPMLQRGDGHWLGKENLWDGEYTAATGVEGAYATTHGVGNVLEIGDTYTWEVGAEGFVSGNQHLRFGQTSTPFINTDGRYEGEVVCAGSEYLKARAGNLQPNAGSLLKPAKVHHLIKLSEYLQKQFIKEQTKVAAYNYEAKSKRFNLVFPDGVDDHVVLNEPIAVVNGSILSGEFQYIDGEVQEFASGDSSDTNGVYIDKNGGAIRAFYYKAGTVGAILGSGSYVFEDRATYRWMVTISDTGLATLFINGEPTDSGQWVLDGNQSIRYLHRRNMEHSVGFQRSFLFIDGNAPLPAGHGGNSVFIPLDDPKGSIAANKLGLDKKGNVVVKDGAGLGPEIMVDLSSPDYLHPNLTSSYEGGVLTVTDGTGNSAYPAIRFMNQVEDGEAYLLTATIDSSGMTERHGFIGVGDNSDTNTERLVGVSEASVTKTMIAYPVGDDNLSFYLDDNNTASGDFVRFSNLSLRKIHGNAFGEWRGLSATFEENQPVTRDADGAYVGENLWDRGVLLTDGTAAPFSIIQGGAIYTPVVDQDHCVTATVSGLTSGALSVQVGSKVNPISADGVYDLSEVVDAALVRVLAGSTPPNSGVSIEISVQPRISLSSELQRQWDLAIVEKQFDKQLKKVLKAHGAATLDRIDDYIQLSEQWQADGAFEIYAWVLPEGNDANGIMWGDNSKFVRSTGGAILTRGIDGDLVTHPIANDGLYHMLKLSYDETTSFLELDGKLIRSAAGLRVPNIINRYGYYHSGLFLGKLGPLLLVDKANPKNSRFYVHNPLGYLEDKLHPDGSMNGTYSGFSPDYSEIQTFKKSGDDWISSDLLTTIKGA